MMTTSPRLRLTPKTAVHLWGRLLFPEREAYMRWWCVRCTMPILWTWDGRGHSRTGGCNHAVWDLQDSADSLPEGWGTVSGPGERHRWIWHDLRDPTRTLWWDRDPYAPPDGAGEDDAGEHGTRKNPHRVFP